MFQLLETIKLLHAPAYFKHISIKRLYNHYVLGQKFKQQAAKEVVIFAKANKIPLIIDARDMWPDILIEAVPKLLRGIAKLMMYPMIQNTKFVYKNATAITAITWAFVEWGLKYADRKANGLDSSYFLSYKKNNYSEELLSKAQKDWSELAVFNDKSKFLICLVGGITKTVRLDLIFECAEILQQKNIPAEFIICGTGDALEKYIKDGENITNVHFMGWITAVQIQTLLNRAALGLLPYESRNDFLMSIPNKFGEYLAAGLPIISTTKGSVEKILNQYECGNTVDSPENFANTILEYYQSPEKRDQISTNARKTYKSILDSRVIYNEFAEFVIDLQKNKYQHKQP